MSRTGYIEGNTVRRMEAVPAELPRERKSKEEREQLRRKKSRQLAAKRNRERALYMSKGYVAFLSLCVLISAWTAVTYIQLQADVTTKMRSIASLESQISTLKADNDARYKSVSTSVDLNYVKTEAINRLGMTYATQGQVIYYTVDNNNFMDQYSDIPLK